MLAFGQLVNIENFDENRLPLEKDRSAFQPSRIYFLKIPTNRRSTGERVMQPCCHVDTARKVLWNTTYFSIPIEVKRFWCSDE